MQAVRTGPLLKCAIGQLHPVRCRFYPREAGATNCSACQPTHHTFGVTGQTACIAKPPLPTFNLSSDGARAGASLSTLFVLRFTRCKGMKPCFRRLERRVSIRVATRRSVPKVTSVAGTVMPLLGHSVTRLRRPADRHQHYPRQHQQWPRRYSGKLGCVPGNSVTTQTCPMIVANARLVVSQAPITHILHKTSTRLQAANRAPSISTPPSRVQSFTRHVQRGNIPTGVPDKLRASRGRSSFAVTGPAAVPGTIAMTALPCPQLRRYQQRHGWRGDVDDDGSVFADVQGC